MNKRGSLAIPVAIVVAGVLIAGAVFLALNKNTDNTGAPNQREAQAKPVPGVQKDDHILGNPDAEIVVIEYSDTECPFCKRMHETLQKTIDKYGKDGKVAWVYRHLPLPQLHSNAPKQAQATECVAKLGGEVAFWKFLNKIYEETPSNNGLDMKKLPEFAKYAGVDEKEFNDCLASDYGKDVIEKHTKQAVEATGGRVGTPYNVILVKGKKEQMTIPGYVPFEQFDQVIQQLLTGQN